MLAWINERCWVKTRAGTAKESYYILHILQDNKNYFLM